jgi:hypothetical protein
MHRSNLCPVPTALALQLAQRLQIIRLRPKVSLNLSTAAFGKRDLLARLKPREFVSKAAGRPRTGTVV